MKKDIVCIGVIDGGWIEVNTYYSTMFKEKQAVRRPIVEIRGMNGVSFHLKDVPGIIELLQEAMEHWREEGE